MLWAIQSGKAGKAEISGSKLSWRFLYRTSEDLLTSSVFERLAYLPTESFMAVLARTFQFDWPAFEEPHISELQFWPRWTPEKRSSKSYVEPDIFLRFEDMKSNHCQDVIIEVKPHATNTSQTVDQWSNQIRTYRQEYAQPDYGLLYLALGGLGQNASLTARSLSQQMEPESKRGVIFCGASWRSLRRAVTSLTDQPSIQRRLVEDILLSLDIAGHRPLTLFNTIKPSQRGQHFATTQQKIDIAFPKQTHHK